MSKNVNFFFAICMIFFWRVWVEWCTLNVEIGRIFYCSPLLPPCCGCFGGQCPCLGMVSCFFFFLALCLIFWQILGGHLMLFVETCFLGYGRHRLWGWFVLSWNVAWHWLGASWQCLVVGIVVITFMLTTTWLMLACYGWGKKSGRIEGFIRCSCSSGC